MSKGTIVGKYIIIINSGKSITTTRPMTEQQARTFVKRSLFSGWLLITCKVISEDTLRKDIFGRRSLYTKK